MTNVDEMLARDDQYTKVTSPESTIGENDKGPAEVELQANTYRLEEDKWLPHREKMWVIGYAVRQDHAWTVSTTFVETHNENKGNRGGSFPRRVTLCPTAWTSQRTLTEVY